MSTACKVVLEHFRVSYTRHLEGLPGTWVERKVLFEGSYEECHAFIQDEEERFREMPAEFSLKITNRPPIQGPEKPPRVLADDELPF